MAAYYNENNPAAARWLNLLIENNLIPRGHVDERSIEDVIPSEISGYTQCHFFAGIGGWPYALRLAGWGDDRLAPYHVVSASIAVESIAIPAVRFVCRPDELAFSGTEKVA